MSSMAELRSSEILAHDLGMTAEDIVGFGMVRYGMDIDRAPTSIVVAVREDLDLHCVRSVPEYWWPSEPISADGRCRCRAFGGIPHLPDETCPLPTRLEEREQG